METIFDHNPTQTEIGNCYFVSFIKGNVSDSELKDAYVSEITEDKAIFDIAMLMEQRGQNPDDYWAKIPELHNEYLLGFDYQINRI